MWDHRSTPRGQFRRRRGPAKYVLRLAADRAWPPRGRDLAPARESRGRPDGRATRLCERNPKPSCRLSGGQRSGAIRFSAAPARGRPSTTYLTPSWLPICLTSHAESLKAKLELRATTKNHLKLVKAVMMSSAMASPKYC